MKVDVEYLSAANWDHAMQARLKWLRENDPVYWSAKDKLWVISKYDDVMAISKDQETFTSAQGVRPGNPAKLGLIDESGPRHMQLRRLLNKGFTPRMVGKLAISFRSMVTEAIDAVAEAGECDFVADIAAPLPLLIIAEMIGIRREDRQRFHHWSDAMIAVEGNMDDPTLVAAGMQAFFEYSEYLKEIVAARRVEPRDDLLSILVNADDEGVLGHFSAGAGIAGQEVDAQYLEQMNSELTMLLTVLMVAGNETTRNALSGGMQLLIENPDQRDKLLRDPSLIPFAVDEIVRLVSPVLSFGRTVTRDTTLRGKSLKKGDTVLMIYPSANRDADVFDRPDEFDVERNPTHLGFGIGNHFCLGANLARMELRVALEEILRRVPDMEYAAGGPEFSPSSLVRSCKRMVVRFTPESAPSRAAG